MAKNPVFFHGFVGPMGFYPNQPVPENRFHGLTEKVLPKRSSQRKVDLKKHVIYSPEI